MEEKFIQKKVLGTVGCLQSLEPGEAEIKSTSPLSLMKPDPIYLKPPGPKALYQDILDIYTSRLFLRFTDVPFEKGVL